MVKVCLNCGFENEEQAKFCKKCGTQLIKENKESVQKTDSAEKSRTNIILATIFICLIIFILALGISNNTNNNGTISSGPSLIVDELSKYHESDVITVHLCDNNNPIANEPIQLKVQNVYGLSTIITNTTDSNGDVSFRLDVESGDYVLSIQPTSSNYNNLKFEKDIFIEKSNLAMYDEDFVIENNEYLVKNKDIYLDLDSYNYETLQGHDDEGNTYIWISGEWWRSEDINNGNIKINF